MSLSAPELGSTSPSFSCLSLVPRIQAAFLQGARSSSGPPRIPDPSLVLRPSLATGPLWPCCPRSINPAQKDYLRNADGHVWRTALPQPAQGRIPGGGGRVTLFTVSPPARQPCAPHQSRQPHLHFTPRLQHWQRLPSWADRNIYFWRNSSWLCPTVVTRGGSPGGCAARAELNGWATQKGTLSPHPGWSQTSRAEKGWGYVETVGSRPKATRATSASKFKFPSQADSTLPPTPAPVTSESSTTNHTL